MCCIQITYLGYALRTSRADRMVRATSTLLAAQKLNHNSIMSKQGYQAIHARLLIVDLFTSIQLIPIVTQLSLWESLIL
jgi:Ni,Fe-hydrogenase III large subunit